MIEAKNITKEFKIGDRSIKVLKNISLKIKEGEVVAIMGESGSGKSTLLSIISGLDNPTTGRIFLGQTEITNLKEDELAPIRNNRIGFVFQSFHLVPSLSTLENVMFPADINNDKQARSKALSLLKRTGLDHRKDSFPHQLSGGERQRVAICRALINDPQIIFADEPTGNLDSKNGKNLLKLLFDLHKEHNNTLVMVTHSDQIAKKADRIILIKDGKMVHKKK